MRNKDTKNEWQDVLDEKEKTIEPLANAKERDIRYLEKELYETLENHLMDYGPVEEARKLLYDIDIKYFETIRREGEELPEILTLEYRDKVIDDFTGELSGILTSDKVSELVKAAINKLEGTYENEVVISILHRIKESLITYAMRRTDNLRNPQISDEALQELYENARRRTIRERIMCDNGKDITAFYVALMNVTAWRCKEVFLRKVREFLDTILTKY